MSAPFRPLQVKVSPENDTNASSRQDKENKTGDFLKNAPGVRRSCRALQFILTATEAVIANQKPNGMPVSALTSRRQASFCQHGRSLPSPPEISAFYSRLNLAYMHPLTCDKYGAAALALGPAHSVTVPRGAAAPPVNIGFASV